MIPPKLVEYRGRSFEEVDVDSIILEEPDLVLIDELAHTYPDGSGKRWEDVAALLEAGLNVITNVNVANLVSVREIRGRADGRRDGRVRP